jgi:phage-related protein
MKRVSAFFYATQSGREPVREWLLSLERTSRREIGHSLMTLEFGWPIGMPLSRSMRQGLHELRVELAGHRSARVFFYVDRAQRLILLHATLKKSKTTAKSDLDLARYRMKDHQRSLE